MSTSGPESGYIFTGRAPDHTQVQARRVGGMATIHQPPDALRFLHNLKNHAQAAPGQLVRPCGCLR